MKQFGETLFKLRKKNGFTQEDIAMKMDLSYKTISKWENGNSTPSMDKIVSLAKIFNVSVDELLSGESKEKIDNNYDVVKPNIDKENVDYVVITQKNLIAIWAPLIIIILAVAQFFLLRQLKVDQYIKLQKGIPIAIALVLISISLFLLTYEILQKKLLKNHSKEISLKARKHILLFSSSFLILFQTSAVFILLDNYYFRILIITLILIIGISIAFLGYNGIVKTLKTYERKI